MPLKQTARVASRGFTLIELAVVLMIIGFLLAGALAMLRPYIQSVQRNATQEKIENIGIALTEFALQRGRLPCPANPNEAVTTEPFGAPRNSGTSGTNFNSPCNSTVNGQNALGNFVGIVPFRALSLNRDAVRDGYGRYITYAVSPVMAGRDGDSQGTELTSAHAQCRQSFWMDTAASTNLNRTKALLCCPRFDSTNNNLNVLDSSPSGVTLFTGQQSQIAAEYGDVNTLWNTTLPTNLTELIAFVLVSHGPNGRGAYTGNGTQQFAGTGTASPDETENSNGDTRFVDHPLISATNTTYFDDVVYWRTNHQLLNAFGNDSCARP